MVQVSVEMEEMGEMEEMPTSRHHLQKYQITNRCMRLMRNGTVKSFKCICCSFDFELTLEKDINVCQRQRII